MITEVKINDVIWLAAVRDNFNRLSSAE